MGMVLIWGLKVTQKRCIKKTLFVKLAYRDSISRRENKPWSRSFKYETLKYLLHVFTPRNLVCLVLQKVSCANWSWIFLKLGQCLQRSLPTRIENIYPRLKNYTSAPSIIYCYCNDNGYYFNWCWSLTVSKCNKRLLLFRFAYYPKPRFAFDIEMQKLQSNWCFVTRFL